MQLVSIGEAARQFGVSTRTLRHYEAEGLLESERDAGGYRFYTPAQLERLGGILILRRLRLPLADIREMMANPNNNEVFAALRQKLRLLAAEQAALHKTQAALDELLRHLQRRTGAAVYNLGAVDADLLALVRALPDGPALQKEAPMQHTEKQLAYRPGDVRIVYLPPMTVAAAHEVGGEMPEEATRLTLAALVRERRLFEKMPGLRSFGFNHPNGVLPDGSDHGYERWVSIPEDMALPAGLAKKRFGGGLYAARAIPFGRFEEWDALLAWAEENPDYEPALRDGAGMSGLLEETLDFIHLWDLPMEAQLPRTQLDLLLPLQARASRQADS